jgi:hypothetical protein
MTQAAPTLYPEELALARHALGLHGNRISYRNRYHCDPDYLAGRIWRGLVSKGLAEETKLRASYSVFRLTRTGAEASLAPGEKLDPEDFP